MLKNVVEDYASDLSSVDFFKANFNWAILSKANLSTANLRTANLQGAILVEANLSWACIAHANLEGASLTNANLTGTDFTKANLKLSDLSMCDLCTAQSFYQALLDPEIMHHIETYCPDLLKDPEDIGTNMKTSKAETSTAGQDDGTAAAKTVR